MRPEEPQSDRDNSIDDIFALPDDQKIAPTLTGENNFSRTFDRVGSSEKKTRRGRTTGARAAFEEALDDGIPGHAGGGIARKNDLTAIRQAATMANALQIKGAFEKAENLADYEWEIPPPRIKDDVTEIFATGTYRY